MRTAATLVLLRFRSKFMPVGFCGLSVEFLAFFELLTFLSQSSYERFHLGNLLV
jgi:hypothetical protein